MPPHGDPYKFPDPNPIHYESGSESPVAQQPLSGESWPPLTTPTSDQSGYPQPHQTLDSIGSTLEVNESGDMNYPFGFPDPSYPIAATSSQGLGVGTDATYTTDDIPSQPFVNSPFHPYPGFNHELSAYAPYDSTQAPAYYALQRPAQIIHSSQASQASAALGYSYTSSSLFQVNHAGPVFRTDAVAPARPAPDSLTMGGADTARTDAAPGQHSHQSPVSSSSANQSFSASPGRPMPSSPERKRLLPLTAEDDFAARRVVPRHDRTSSVHSRISMSPKRSRSNSAVFGRGLRIPQERYTTTGISSYNTPDHPVIVFNLENPDEYGVPIIDILNKSEVYNRIRDRAEVFDMAKKTFTLRVQWPGYRLWSKTIAAKDWRKTRGPVARVKLAEAVATAMRDLFEKYRDKRCDPDNELWNVGPNGIQLDQICLVALHSVSKGSWQPELCLLGPRP